MKAYYFIYNNGWYTRRFISTDKEKVEAMKASLGKYDEPTKNISEIVEVDIDEIVTL